MAEIINLAKEISDIVDEYVADIQGKLEAELQRTANKILEYIKSNAPRGKYSKTATADTFEVMKKGEGKNLTYIIYNKKKGRLLHLIEFGFEHRSGKFISARPFMRPAFDEFTPSMIEEIKKILEGK